MNSHKSKTSRFKTDILNHDSYDYRIDRMTQRALSSNKAITKAHNELTLIINITVQDKYSEP